MTTLHTHRFERIFEYVDEHTDDQLSVDVLSKVAGVSRFHFQRQFAQRFNMSVQKYVQLVRLRRSLFQLAFRPHRILDIALDAGYASHEAFTRAFEKAMGLAPSAFRSSPDWDAWFGVQQRLHAITAQRAVALASGDVRIEQFPGARLAVMEHRGCPRQLPETIRRFIAWRRESGVSAKSATYNVVYNDPERVEPTDFRLDICVAIDQLPPNAADAGVIPAFIPPLRCAVIRHIGSEDKLWRKVAELYARWLPQNGETAGERPLLLRRVRFFPDVAECDAVTDVLLPVAERGR
jgi:AraC family transcriptional regulator